MKFFSFLHLLYLSHLFQPLMADFGVFEQNPRIFELQNFDLMLEISCRISLGIAWGSIGYHLTTIIKHNLV